MEGGSGRKRPLENTEDDGGPKKKKPRPVSRKRRPGFDEEIFSETTYFIRNGKFCYWHSDVPRAHELGLRCVKPYYFTFTTHAKGRWVGSTVYSIFCKEFQSETPEFYERAIQAGKVIVNGKVATMETVIGNNDLVCHRVHRHEPPVSAQPIRILHQDNQLVAIDKPPSIPVHPCGRYRHNSVVFLLGKEHNLRNLHTIHRLDRLTSGLMMFAKSLATAQKIEVQIRERQVAKEYLCRVQGEFPSEPVECNEPIVVVSNKLGVCQVDPSGKPCSTLFSRLSYNGSSSVVKCIPKTGRMHQIRVHLQWIGFPILQDPLYNHPAWGTERGKQGRGITDMDQVLSEIVKTNYSSGLGSPGAAEAAKRKVGTAGDALDSAEEGGKETRTPSVEQQEQSTVHEKGGERTRKSSLEAEQQRTEGNLKQDSGGTQRLSVSSLTDTNSEETKGTGTHTDAVKTGMQNSVAERTLDTGSSVKTVQPSLEIADKECKEKVATAVQPITITSAHDYSGCGGERMGRLCGKQHASCRRESGGESERPCEGGAGPMGLQVEKDPDCTECALARPDPTPRELFMYLHALSYKGPDWEFHTDVPAWAAPDWQEDY